MKSTLFSVFRIPRPQNFLILMIMLTVLCTACGPKKLYVGPYLPDEEIAIIKPDDAKTFTHVNIRAIDQYDINDRGVSFAVHPGEHTVFFEVVLDYPYLDQYLFFSQDMTFNAEAGHIYTLHASILPMRNEGFAWISSDQEPEMMIVKKYAAGIIPLSNYP